MELTCHAAWMPITAVKENYLLHWAAICGGDSESAYFVSETSDKMVRIPNKIVAKVQKALEYNARRCFSELTPLDEITLVKEVTLEQFQKWATNNAHKKSKEWGLKVEYIDGRIIGGELVGRNHAWAAGSLFKMLSRQDPNDDLQFGVDEDMDFAQGQQYAADVTVNVKGNYVGQSPNLVDLRGHAFMVVVVEIGVAQSAPDLCKKLQLYSTIPSLQFYVAIKRYATDGMVAIKFDRVNLWQPVSIISFGTVPLHRSVISYIQGQWPGQPILGVGFGGPPCDAANLAPYMIPLPSASIFIDCQRGVPVAAPGVYHIDLFGMAQVLGI